MKKIFTLFAATLMAAGAYAQEQVTITWSLADKTLAPVVEGGAGVTAEAVNPGSNFTFSKNNSVNGTAGTEFAPSSAYPKKSTAHYIQFPFTVESGKIFTITEISYYTAKCGTGDTFNANVFLLDSDNTKRTIVNGVVLYRNNESEGWYNTQSFTAAEMDEAFTGGNFNPYTAATHNLTFSYCTPDKTTNTKSVWLANVVIKGEVIDESAYDTRPAAPISWSKATVSYKVRADLSKVTLPTLSNSENLDVTYTSTNEAIATVDASGTVTLKNDVIGKTSIAATFTPADESVAYSATTVEYVIEVVTNKVRKDVNPTDLTPATFKLDGLYAADKDSYPAGEIFSDDNLTIIAHSATINGGTAANYGGQKFTKSIQVRVNSEPSDEDPYGEEYGNTDTEAAKTTSLVVKPKVNLILYVFGRRQTVEDTDAYAEIDDVENNVITCQHVYSMVANDGKSLKFDDITDPKTVLEKNIYLGAWTDNVAYAYGISEIELEAGKEYNMYAVATTYQVNGIGYILYPDVPKAAIDGTDHDGSTINLDGVNKTVKLTAANAAHNLYYHFAAADEDENEDFGPGFMLFAAAQTMQHEGKTYTLVPESGITLKKAGTLSYFAHDPVNDLKSAVSTIDVTGEGTEITTAITGIAGDNATAPVEYYNLQGVRVTNPANGLYLRRQGDKVEKVYVK